MRLRERGFRKSGDKKGGGGELYKESEQPIEQLSKECDGNVLFWEAVSFFPWSHFSIP